MLPELLLIQKLLALALTIPLVDCALKLKKNKNKLATSKLGGIKDMGRLNGTDGMILSKNFQLNFKKTLEGVCVIAPTGEGKTTSLFLPNLLSNHLPKSSIIIADPKGEQYELSHLYQESIGRKCVLFEPLGVNAKYNPLEHCENFTEVRELASNLIQNGSLALRLAGGGSAGDSTWENMSIPIFTAALLNSKTINEALTFLIDTPLLKQIEILGNNANKDIRQQFAIFMSSGGSPKTMSSIISTVLSSLQLFTDHNIIISTSESDFKPTDLREQPIALYIKFDESKANYLSPFLSVFYTQLIDKIMYNEGLPVIFMLDEAQNTGRISNLAQIVATGRSRGLGFMICLQNLVRLYDIYGKNNTTTILNNLKCKVVLPSISDYEALNYLSSLCGDREVDTISKNDKNTNTSKTVKKLFTADEIRRIEDDKLLIIAHNKLPFLDKQNLYYTQEKYTRNVLK